MHILLLNLTAAQWGVEECGQQSFMALKTDAPFSIMEQSDYSEVWVVFEAEPDMIFIGRDPLETQGFMCLS